MFDYVAGEADWLAFGLPTEGANADTPRAGDVAGRDAPTCGPGDRLGDVRERARAAGWDGYVVVNNERVVLGRIRGDALDGDPVAPVEAVMECGPTTVRPSEPLDALTERMRDRKTSSVLVTTSDGRLVGVLKRDDAERRLAEAR